MTNSKRAMTAAFEKILKEIEDILDGKKPLTSKTKHVIKEMKNPKFDECAESAMDVVFKKAVKEIGETLSYKKPVIDKTNLANKVISNYTIIKARRVRAEIKLLKGDKKKQLGT